MLRLLAFLAAAGLVSTLAQYPDARACRLPHDRLQTGRDTAAWCAREFVIRNGYTSEIGSSAQADIALEPFDVGLGFQAAVSNRRNTLGGVPLFACANPKTYLVAFTMPNQVDASYGRGVVMTKKFDGLAVLQPWVRILPIPPGCAPPHIP
jgi:hypothetical protein